MLCVLYLASAGYLITFNATEYEFDVNVYSPNETVVFEAFLVAENINADFVIRVGFNGAATEFDPYSINGMNSSVIITSTQSTDPLLTIRLEEPLDPNDDQIDYTFALAYLAAGAGVKSEEAKVIIHEIGKLATT